MDGFRALQLDGSRLVLQRKVPVARKGPAMPEQQHQHRDESYYAYGASGGNAAAGPLGSVALPRRIPHFSQADEDQDQWPIRGDDRPGVERGPPAGIEEQRSERDEHDGKDQGRPPRRSALRGWWSCGSLWRHLLRHEHTSLLLTTNRSDEKFSMSG